MTHDRKDDDYLETLFAASRAAAPEPSRALLAKVMADAEAQFSRSAAVAGIWTRLLDAIGGWGGMGGLATATCAGIWIGFSSGYDLNSLTSGIIDDGSAVVELMPGAVELALLGATEE